MKLIVFAVITVLLLGVSLALYCMVQKIKKDSSCFAPDFSSMKFSKAKCDCV